jgi:S-adenosylmethionine hydrolase
MPIVTLLTDFGTADSYVAEVKGVLLSRGADVSLVDITHDLRPGDVRAAQYLLRRTWKLFPTGTVHLAIVDPGVGTSRRALAVEYAGHRFVAPDNGLLSFLPSDARYVALPTPAAAAPTFHGRDIFAPAAAALAVGARLEGLGEAVSNPYRDPLPTHRVAGGAIVGEVVFVDRFGTLISNIPADLLPPSATVRVDGTEIGHLRRTFADVAPDELVAFRGSDGAVEIAVRDGSAAAALNVGVGTEVQAERK